MSGVLHVALGELMASRVGSVDPTKFPSEVFDLYSIPAFDKGPPEIAVGTSIGSSKQIVRPGDVLLSKIVPHIRRSWVVGKDRGRRLIASGEWIVFRSERTDQAYLRHVLVGDPFHSEFMQTVSGVGGSLLRARPVHVAKITVPLPPLPEQRRIAAILDQADALRAKRRGALAQLDNLTQSIFIEMFGEPTTNPRNWPLSSLSELCSISGEYGAGLSSCEFDPSRPRYVRITDINGQGKLISEAVSPAGKSSDWDGYELQEGDVLFARSGATVGKTYLYKATDGKCVFAGYLIRFRPDTSKLLPSYLFQFTRTPAYLAWVGARQRVVAQPNINAKQYGNDLLFPVPPIELQMAYATKLAALDAQKALQTRAAGELDALFLALQHRAFQGNL